MCAMGDLEVEFCNADFWEGNYPNFPFLDGFSVLKVGGAHRQSEVDSERGKVDRLGKGLQ